MTIHRVNHLGNFAFCHQLVAEVKRNVRRKRQEFANFHAARRGVDDAVDHLAFRSHFLHAALDLGVERNDARSQCVVNFRRVAKSLAFARFTVADDREIIEAKNDIL